jgi:peptidylprolyl isomerase
MAQVKFGDTVRVHYTGRLENDKTGFDSTENREPLEFTIGTGRIIAGFEKAVVGMTPGESKTVKIPSAEAYGPHQEQLVAEVSLSQLPDDCKPQIGQVLNVTHGKGRSTPVMIVAISESHVKLDANHPLAGKDLIFDIRLLAIPKTS